MKQAIRREEASSSFAAKCVRAIRLFQGERAWHPSPTIDVLVEQHHLRSLQGSDDRRRLSRAARRRPGRGSQTQNQTSTSALQRAQRLRADEVGRRRGGRARPLRGSTGTIKQPPLGAVPGGIAGVSQTPTARCARTTHALQRVGFRYRCGARSVWVRGAGRERRWARRHREGPGRGPGARGSGRSSFGRGFGAPTVQRSWCAG
jgi:hypothetical protein